MRSSALSGYVERYPQCLKQLRHSSSVNLSSGSPQSDQSASTVLAEALFNSALNFEKTSSMEFRSGLYGGR